MLGHDVLRALPELRSHADSLLFDLAVVTRPGASTFDPNTGLITPTAGATVHTGPCRLRQPDRQESEALFGEQQVTVSRAVVDFPHDVAGIRIDDVITLVESRDPEAVGRPFRVIAVPAATLIVHRSYACEAVD